MTKPIKRKDVRVVVEAGLARRKRREKHFRWLGMSAILIGIAFLGAMLLSIVLQGYKAFTQTRLQLDVVLEQSVIDPQGNRDEQAISNADYTKLLRNAIYAEFPNVTDRNDKRSLFKLLSSGAAYDLRSRVMDDPDLIGTTQKIWVTADDDLDMEMKYGADKGRLSEKQLVWVDELKQKGRLERQLNTTFFTAGDSREPELAGIRGALLGSIFTLLLTMVLAFPIGVGAAIYLEEFAPKNRWTDLIEVNINNLAAVPSIVFGLLGLAVYIGFFGLPRSTPIVGALVLTLMTMPIIIIASRAAIKSVPPSIREAALGLGASPMQAAFHHVLPLALPGMLTGSILGMAHALGETAPLLMIGMVAFIVDIPQGFTDPATVLPVQIYLWADSPERGFLELTSAAILVLLAFLILMNLLAISLRRKFEKRW